MRHVLMRILRKGREYLTHWFVAGAVLAATGAAPEHWMAVLFDYTRLPKAVLHFWSAEIDLRVVLPGLGLMLIAGDITWRHTRPAMSAKSASAIPTAPGGGSISADGSASADPTTALPDKPSIVVLPFRNISEIPEQEYFSDGVAEDIITYLSRNHALFVIARNTSFTYRGKTMDMRQIARDLGVRYVLDGSVQRAGDRMRIAAQLIEADSGNNIWAEQYDVDHFALFNVQDEITLAVAAAIGPAIADAEMSRAMRRPPQSLSAWDVFQQGMWLLSKHGPEGNREARACFERAIELDPTFAAAYAGLSNIYLRAAVQYATMPMREGISLALKYARNAVQLDAGDAIAQSALAEALFHDGDAHNALLIVNQALAMNSNCARAYLTLGTILIFNGRMSEGRDAIAAFARLSPRDEDIGIGQTRVAVSFYFEHDYQRCVDVAQNLLSVHPDAPLIHRWLAAAQGQLCRVVEARAALEKSRAISPREFGNHVLSRPPWRRPDDHELMLDGLRKAGWPSSAKVPL